MERGRRRAAAGAQTKFSALPILQVDVWALGIVLRISKVGEQLGGGTFGAVFARGKNYASKMARLHKPPLRGTLLLKGVRMEL